MAIASQGFEFSTVRATVQPGPSLAELATVALRQSPYRLLRCIRCDLHDGVLTLRGFVDSYYLKQTAQEVVRRVPGVELIANRIEVVDARVPAAW
jgi:osmotically-inducible protein OsmY